MPALVEIGVAVVALLLLLAIALLLLVAEHAIPDIPVIGSAIRDAIVSALTAVRNALFGFLKSVVRPILDVTWRGMLLNMRALGWIANAVIKTPWAIAMAAGWVRQLAMSLYGQAVSIVQSYYNQAVWHADAVGAQVLGDAEGLYNSAVAHADAIGATVLGDAENLYNQAVWHADGLFATAEADIGRVAGTIGAAVDGAVVHAEQLFTTAEADIGRLEGIVQADIATAVRVAEGYAEGVAAVLSAAAATGVIAQVMPLVQALTTEADTCLKPLCDTVTPNAPQLGRLGTILKDLEGLGLAALVLALLDEAYHHPADVVRAVRTVSDDVARPVLDAGRQLIGA